MDRIQLEKFLDFLSGRGIRLCSELQSDRGWQTFWTPLSQTTEELIVTSFLKDFE